MKKIIKAGLIISTLLPLMAMAQGGISTQQPLEPGTNIQNILDRIGNWALGLLLALATLFIIYAAYIYLTAAGDPEKVGSAKNILIYAAVAIAIGLLSRAIVFIVKQLLGA